MHTWYMHLSLIAVLIREFQTTLLVAAQSGAAFLLAAIGVRLNPRACAHCHAGPLSATSF